MSKWRNISLVGAAAGMLLLTACGANTQPTGTTVVQPAAGASGLGVAASPSVSVGTGISGIAGTGAGSSGSGASGSGTSSGTQNDAAGQLVVRADAKLGSLVTDSKGFTLYRFDTDKSVLGKSSNCNGDCAKTWPPVSADDATASANLNPDLLGSITRADGTKQLTLAGWPMYRFSKDTAAGQTNGQGVKGTWFAAAPDGFKAGVTRKAINILDDPKLGKILTDKNGKTLYLFTKDTPWPMKTACDATCLQTWTPSGPITTKDAEAIGLDFRLFLRFTTPNGTVQNSVNCWLAYTFKGDKEPGQTNGQGVKGVWFAIRADAVDDHGKTVPKAVDSSSSSSSSSGY